jgi:tRNA A37 threonylcarbamoyladenosine dehydratase
MKEWQRRTSMLIGEDSLRVLASSSVAVFGLGGVGSYAVEALARAGVGRLVLVDNDRFSESNINRQLYALPSTVGRLKTEVTSERVKEINPECVTEIHNEFFLPENADNYDFASFDCVLDCIDTVTGKIELAVRCTQAGTKIISAMGAGNKLHPEMFEVSDIMKTSVCPLAKVMRHELSKRGVKHLTVVYSKETAIIPASSGEETVRRSVPGSISFVPSAMGLIMAGEAVRQICSVN